MLWSLVAAFAVSQLLQNLRGLANVAFRVVIGVVIFAGLLYPVFGLITKTNSFNPPYGFSLDDFDRIIRENPERGGAAINFLRTAPDGVIAEAIGDGYSAFARISAQTGMQTCILAGHEDQWRGSYAPQGTRRDDINRLYTTVRWEEAALIIEQYDIRYVYVVCWSGLR